MSGMPPNNASIADAVSRSVVIGNSLQINPQATCNWTEVFLRMVAILPLTRVDIVALFSLIELAPLRRGFLFRIDNSQNEPRKGC